MPKDRSNSSSSLNHSRASPYSCSSKNTDQCNANNNLQSVGDEKEWEDTRCAICMEHPHNAVLLLCSSHEKGCHPYMCDTSYRHSNCLDQFKKSSSLIKTTDIGDNRFCRNNSKLLEQKLPCPLCRGQISGWRVVEPARSFMNSRPRSCSLETCNFIGSYSELRKHARLEHPSIRPTEADPTRQQEWARLENERTFQDLLDISGLGDDLSDFSDMLLLDDFSSFFPELESESERIWEEMMDMDENEIELPFSFIEIPFPFEVPFPVSSVSRSPEQSYRTIREFNRSTTQPAYRSRGYTSRRIDSNRDQHQQNSRRS